MTMRERVDVLMAKAADNSLPAMLFLLLLVVLAILISLALVIVLFEINVLLGFASLVGGIYWLFIKITNRQAK